MRTYILVLLVNAVIADKCLAPIMPTLDGCSECAASELNGMQCVRSGRWFPCSADMQSCCRNGEVSNNVGFDTCVGDAGDPDPKICIKVVSKLATVNNDHCSELCDKLVASGGNVKKDEAFNKVCMYQHYDKINGRTTVDDTCFEKWVYGYSEPNDNASYKPGLTAETPAQCQLLCQQDEECVNWLWASDLYNDSGRQDVKYRCDLKNREMVDKAAEIKFTANGPTNMDYKYCNSGLPYMCTGGGYRCLPCGSDDIPSCIWESHMHVSGWRHCVPTPLCGRIESTMAPTPQKTTAPTLVSPTSTGAGGSNAAASITSTSGPTPAASAPTNPTRTLQSTGFGGPTPTASPASTPSTSLATAVSSMTGSMSTLPQSDSSNTEQTDLLLSTTDDDANDCDSERSGADCEHKIHPCGTPCNCRGGACSPCCRKQGAIEIHVMDRPKHLAFEVDN